ncbi:MAG: hypothetical protein ABIK90_06920, partial [candidate division WOR-3 bacterium]
NQISTTFSPTPTPSPMPSPTPEPTLNPEQTLAIITALDNLESEESSGSGTATASANLTSEEIEAMVEEILTSADQNNNYLELNSYPSLTISKDLLNINRGLAVNGPALLNQVTITQSLNIGGTLNLADNAINTFNEPLYLQSFGLAGIDILAGKIRIDKSGNAIFSANLEVQGELIAKEIKPAENQNLVINLANIPIEENLLEENELLPPASTQLAESGFGKLLIKGIDGETVVSIDASGSALFAGDIVASGSGTFEKIIIAEKEASRSGEIISGVFAHNATAGTAVLPAGKNEVIIYSPFISEKSLVYITPLSSTLNQVLYVKAQSPTTQECRYPEEENVFGCGWFKVAIDRPLPTDVRFNWWIIN